MKTVPTGDNRLVPPRPQDLTPEKILDRMKNIKIGDEITFDSFKECFRAAQLDRHSATIKVTARVVEHCGGYLMVKLKRGILESVNYFDIEAVNGKRFIGYIKK